MKIDSICEEMVRLGGASAIREEVDMPGPVVRVEASCLRPVMEYLRAEDFASLMSLAGIDYQGFKPVPEFDGKLGVVYHLFSPLHRLKVTIRVLLAREAPVLPTVSDLWPTANWHEREAFDLYGIDFAGHPDFRRILLPDDWVGHPLRKDYEMPTEYRGIRHREEPIGGIDDESDGEGA